MTQNLIIRAGLLIALSTGSAAFAQIGLGYGGGAELETFHDPQPGSNAYHIDGQFEFVPGAGGWMKNLFAPPGGWLPGQVYTIHETITFFPPADGTVGQPLSDWHEHIELGSDGNIWDIWVDGSSMFTVDGTTPAGLMTMLNMEKTDIWFLFDPIDIGPNGIRLDIWKEFQFVGMTPMFDPVRIYEYPTPAPGAAALLGIAGLCSARRRR